MWRIGLLVILFLTVVDSIRAQNIDNEIAAIVQYVDKTIVVSKLNQLLDIKDQSPSRRIKILLNLSRAYISLSDLNKALIAIKKAQALVDQHSLSLERAKIDKLKGVILYYQGQYEQSLLSYQAALAYFRQQLFTSEIALKQAHLLNNIALVQTTLGESFDALKNYQEADLLYERYGDESDKIDVRYNLAVLYLSIRRYDIAIDMFEEAIEKLQVLKDEHGIAKASAGIGVAYKHSGQYQLAELYVLEGLNYFKKNKYQLDVASQLHNLAEINFELSNIDKAYNYALEGAQLSHKIGHQMTYGGCLYTLAKIYFHQGDIENAQNNANLSFKIAQSMGFKQLINDNLGLKSLLYAEEGYTANALNVLKSYEQSSLKLANEALNEQIAQYESAQLSQQVSSLKQSKKLQQLESTREDQQRQIVVLFAAFFLIVAFMVYRRFLESKLKKSLENKVKERTEALEYLTKELQNASTVKSQFLANMSHEIRTPLTAVLGQAEAIIHGDLDNKNLLNEVKVIHNNSLHLLQLINDILDLSKIEANKFELENRRQDLHVLIKELNDMFTEQAQRKQLIFSVTGHLPKPFIIDIDDFRLKQILINLCSNAIKFTSEGWVSLDIAFIDQTLLFTVTDTGIGMNSEQMSKMFNIFTQGDNTISRRFSGSGLGLFLSEQIAKVMSGNITVNSELNHGSTFVLRLPFGDTYADVDETEKSKLPYVKANKKQYKGKILLAEDHDDNRRLIARLLTSYGLEVLEAANGLEAIELCIAHHPKITLLDIQMPKMNGIQALQAIHQLDVTHSVYALTANAMAHEVAQYLALGFAGHLKKPIERDIFIPTVMQHYPQVYCPDANACLSLDEVKIDEIKQVEETFDISDIIPSFIQHLSQDKQDILLYFNAGNHSGLARIAHKISGAAQMFGFPEISQSAVDLERVIKNNIVASIDDLTHCLLDEITSVLHKNKEKKD